MSLIYCIYPSILDFRLYLLLYTQKEHASYEYYASRLQVQREFLAETILVSAGCAALHAHLLAFIRKQPHE